MTIRWLVLIVVCLLVQAGWWVVEHELVTGTRPICPEQWWRSSPGLCAYPPVSIMVWSVAYGLKALLLLAAVAVIAPAHKFRSCMLLLAALALWPIYELLFEKLSWVAMGSLATVIGIGVCFMLARRLRPGLFASAAQPRAGMSP